MKRITQLDMFGRKECSKCWLVLPLSDFVRDPRKSIGVTSSCKSCRGKHSLEYMRRNADKIKAKRSSDEGRAYVRQWYAKNSERIRAQRREFFKTPEGKARQAGYARDHRKRDRQHRVRMTLRSRINLAIQSGSKSASTEELLGCAVAEFIAHIESQWAKGMSWENYGLGRECWHIDHIRPCASFDLSDPAQQRECFHYSNCQPLWALDNYAKGAKFVEVDQ